MIKFEVGDKVKMRCNCSGCLKGKIYTLMRLPNGSLKCDTGNMETGCSCGNKWELVEPLKKNEVKVFGISIFLDSIKGMGK
jgi:hypothetical protein